LLAHITIPAMILGIDSDVLYPLYEQEYMAQHMPRANFQIITSQDGHDGFLLEQEQVGSCIQSFLNSLSTTNCE
jgi:homoserine O-acetyltransferase/O-succinyltransferase